MSRKLDPETEDLLWAAAESDDPAVVEEFERRFPDLRPELATRRVMVDVLRKSRPDARGSVRANFEPSPKQKEVLGKRVVLIPAMAALLGVLAFGAYQATLYFTRGKEESPPITSVGDPQASGPQPTAPSGETGDTATGVIPDGMARDPETGRPYGVGERPPNPPQPEKLVELPPETTLFAALDQFSQQTGFSVQVLPGVVDAPIRLFDGQPGQALYLPPGEAIRAIERAGNVRILDNGPEGYLVFPAGDSQPGSDPLGGPGMQPQLPD
ncbi:MAG: hypothetical protein KIT74_07960 [Fimbriimonadales bacterium]|nr:hypothetical protein [Fimbriimonadales bacterium]